MHTHTKTPLVYISNLYDDINKQIYYKEKSIQYMCNIVLNCNIIYKPRNSNKVLEVKEKKRKELATDGLKWARTPRFSGCV